MLKKITVMATVLGLVVIPATTKASAAVRVPANLMITSFDDPQSQHEASGDQHQADVQDDDKDIKENDKDLQENDKEVQENHHDDGNMDDQDADEDRDNDAQQDLQQPIPPRG